MSLSKPATSKKYKMVLTGKSVKRPPAKNNDPLSIDRLNWMCSLWRAVMRNKRAGGMTELWNFKAIQVVVQRVTELLRSCINEDFSKGSATTILSVYADSGTVTATYVTIADTGVSSFDLESMCIGAVKCSILQSFGKTGSTPLQLCTDVSVGGKCVISSTTNPLLLRDTMRNYRNVVGVKQGPYVFDAVEVLDLQLFRDSDR
eukprot:g70718.t1